jgi:drug/metabolite transporter, DME family
METIAISRRTARRSLLLIAIAAVLWGTVGVTTKTLYRLTPTTPISVGFFRLAFAAPILLAACWARLGRRAFAVEWRGLRAMLLVGAMLACYQVCFFAAVADAGVVIATLVTLCSAPVLVALFSVALLRQRLAMATALALACAIAGTMLLVVTPDAGSHASVRGVLLALASAAGYAAIALAARGLARRYHPLQVTAIGFAAGALLLLPIALAAGLVVSYPAAGWLLLVYLGAVPSALGYGLYLTGMRVTLAPVASIVTLIEPLTATILAWTLLGERLGPWGVPGALLLLSALAVLYRGAAPESSA